MSQVVDRSAELTAFRARDMLDATLAAALRDLLRPQQMSIHRCVGEDADKRWMTRARLRLDDAAPASDPPWTALHQLPPLADFPARLQALRQQVVVVLAGPPHTAVFPLTTDRDVVGVLEIGSAQALDGDAHRRVGSILRIHCNFQALLDDSERDTLTGLLNRKTFDEAFYKLAAGIDIGMPPPMSGCAAASRPTPFPQVGSVSVSVGHIRLKPGDTPSAAFERADRAVYWAKGHSRNQVCSHAELVARGELGDGAAKSGDVALFYTPPGRGHTSSAAGLASPASLPAS